METIEEYLKRTLDAKGYKNHWSIYLGEDNFQNMLLKAIIRHQASVEAQLRANGIIVD